MKKPTQTSEEHVLLISIVQVSIDVDWTGLFELKTSNNLVQLTTLEISSMIINFSMTENLNKHLFIRAIWAAR